MKFSITLFLLFTTANWMMSQQLDYYPERKPTVSDADYRYGRKVLEETYYKVRADGQNFCYADYWNLAVAYMALDQDRETIREFIYRSKELDPGNFNAIFEKFAVTYERWAAYFSETEFRALAAERAGPADEVFPTKQPAEFEAPVVTGGTNNPDLVQQIAAIGEKDQRYRGDTAYDAKRQARLDAENLAAIDALYAQYGSYLGTSLVGKRYRHVMWSVIQHADPAVMERYLPVLQKAVAEGELGETALKMTIDRVYARKYACQIFGSQQGVPLAAPEVIRLAKRAYGFQDYRPVPPPAAPTIERQPAAPRTRTGTDRSAAPGPLRPTRKNTSHPK